MSVDHQINVTEKWVAEPLALPDGDVVFSDLRNAADGIFSAATNVEDWMSHEMQQHILEVGETHMVKNVEELAALKEEEVEARVQEWNMETAEHIEMAREEVNTFQEDLRQNNRDVELRLREEEVAARDRLVYEHQAMEARLLGDMRGTSGMLQTVPVDKFSWTVEWDRAPQEFNLNVTCLRGVRSKVRDGYYVIMASVVDRVGGQTLRFSTGKDNEDCAGALPPLRFHESSAAVDHYINASVEMKCPAAKVLQTYACLVFEVWQLRVGNYDRTDRVIGWGVWPLVDRDFNVVEGKFKLPLIKGDVDKGVDTYRHIAHSLQTDLKYWLGNLYFEIRMNRSDHSILQAKYDSIEGKAGASPLLPLLPEVTTYPQQKQDKLRLAKTVDDHHKLIVPKLPPRLFFDDVSLGNEGSQGLRRRYFGSEDMRPLNAALWEKRALLEDERTAMSFELSKKNRRTDDNAEETDRLVREDLTKHRNHLAGNIYKRFPDVNFCRGELVNGQTKEKVCDSHILLLNHHTAIGSQREFFFLGRRYRDRLVIASNTLMYDMGINLAGNWDKSKLITNIVFLIIGLIARNLIHSVGLWMFLNFKDVPLEVNSWNILASDLRFEFTDRFYPSDTLITMFIGVTSGMFFFLFFGVAMWCLLMIFQWLPYFATRFLLWFGVAVFFDPVISAATQAGIGNTHSGDAFVLMNQLTKEEGGPVSGWLLTLSCYLCLMVLQGAALYWYACAVHLNGRVNDVYDRIVFPERSFFLPHDIEVSERDLRDVVAEAKKFRDEEKGTVKNVRVNDFSHKYTCFFRARLYKLLSIRSDNAEEWISEYMDSIPLRRPKHSERIIEKNLGSYRLGSDIMSFMRRHFPHMMVMSKYRVGDMPEDSYYEAELRRAVQMHSTPNEDDLEMRSMLKAYFKAQVDGPKPARWSQTESNEEETTYATPFEILDWQLLADLIFFETTTAAFRSLNLRLMIYGSAAETIAAEKKNVFTLANFVDGKPTTSTAGRDAMGAVVQIFKENPARNIKELSRVFVVTPFGAVIEPNRTSFSLMEQHTADDIEFWAQRGIEVLEDAAFGVPLNKSTQEL